MRISKPRPTITLKAQKETFAKRVLEQTKEFCISSLYYLGDFDPYFVGPRLKGKQKRAILDAMIAEGLIEVTHHGEGIPLGGDECGGKRRMFSPEYS